MSSLTIQEKEALQEVFLCFESNQKWYQNKDRVRKKAFKKMFKMYVKNKIFIRKVFLKKHRRYYV